jgi:hypothetical protein
MPNALPHVNGRYLISMQLGVYVVEKNINAKKIRLRGIVRYKNRMTGLEFVV